tara:strand:+ start:2425 stop:2664 length:240 start_codon:yes stop_codon:yes gene_type:complete
MLDKIKELLSNWKISVTLAGGAIVVMTVFGKCTFEPNLDLESGEESPEVSSEVGEESSHETTSSTIEEATEEATEETSE